MDVDAHQEQKILELGSLFQWEAPRAPPPPGLEPGQ